MAVAGVLEARFLLSREDFTLDAQLVVARQLDVLVLLDHLDDLHRINRRILLEGDADDAGRGVYLDHAIGLGHGIVGPSSGSEDQGGPLSGGQGRCSRVWRIGLRHRASPSSVQAYQTLGLILGEPGCISPAIRIPAAHQGPGRQSQPITGFNQGISGSWIAIFRM